MAASSTGSSALVHVRAPGSSVMAPTVDRAEAGGAGAAAQDRADAGDQLAGAERLDHVVVGAEFEAEDAVDLLAASGEHDDRHVGGRSDLAGEVAAVAVGKHHVEQDHVGSGALVGRAGLVEGARDLGVEPLPRQVLEQRLRDALLVLNDQDPLPHIPMVVAKPQVEPWSCHSFACG